MMNRRLLLLLILLVATQIKNVLGNEIVEATIQDYFDITEREDMASYLDIMIIPQEASETELFTQRLWDLYDTKDIIISEYQTTITEDGLRAASTFQLEGTLVQQETGDSYQIATEYIAVLRQVDNKWKIEYVMPLDKFSQVMGDISNARQELDTIYSAQVQNKMDEKDKNKFPATGIVIFIVAIILIGIGYSISKNKKGAKKKK
ncbi:hypothetical protein JXC34_01110 [Candidatus Woesearchaeota archaeon]|nr:hypothetical protein [Candidatus Woesearchaeota archaeon]